MGEMQIAIADGDVKKSGPLACAIRGRSCNDILITLLRGHPTTLMLGMMLHRQAVSVALALIDPSTTRRIKDLAS